MKSLVTVAALACAFFTSNLRAEEDPFSGHVQSTGDGVLQRPTHEACQNTPPQATWTNAYTRCLEVQIPEYENLLSLRQNQVGHACPRYSQLNRAQRSAFISAYVQNWAKIESGGNTQARIVQGREERKGLFALRPSDLAFCGVSGDLLDAPTSMRCALRLMSGHRGPFGFYSSANRQVFRPAFLAHTGPRNGFITALKSAVPRCFNR